MENYYCYVLHFPDLNEKYVGLKVGKDRNPDNLLKSYKTSSTRVKSRIRAGHKVEILEIIEFENSDDAIEYEYQYLKRIKTEKGWLNKKFNRHYGPVDK